MLLKLKLSQGVIENTILRPKLPQIFLKMAKSSFEYVKKFELDDTLLPNTWIVVRLDGKCFHKFSEDHKFSKPNDVRALNLMNYAAYKLLREHHDLLMAFGQSDEYSFIFKKNSTFYNRRAAKLLTTINSKFSSSYVFYWRLFFGDEPLKYPPTFDGRIILYPSDENLVDYMKWRQADVHINNLYNTTFWNLVLKGNLSPSQAEKRLCGTVSADKNEILFKEFNINYNNEPEMFKRGTLLLKRTIVKEKNKYLMIVVDMHDDMLKDKFWKDNFYLLSSNSSKQDLIYEGPITDIIEEQLKTKYTIVSEYYSCFSPFRLICRAYTVLFYRARACFATRHIATCTSDAGNQRDPRETSTHVLNFESGFRLPSVLYAPITLNYNY